MTLWCAQQITQSNSVQLLLFWQVALWLKAIVSLFAWNTTATLVGFPLRKFPCTVWQSKVKPCTSSRREMQRIIWIMFIHKEKAMIFLWSTSHWMACSLSKMRWIFNLDFRNHVQFHVELVLPFPLWGSERPDVKGTCKTGPIGDEAVTSPKEGPNQKIDHEGPNRSQEMQHEMKFWKPMKTQHKTTWMWLFWLILSNQKGCTSRKFVGLDD